MDEAQQTVPVAKGRRPPNIGIFGFAATPTVNGSGIRCLIADRQTAPKQCAPLRRHHADSAVIVDGDGRSEIHHKHKSDEQAEGDSQDHVKRGLVHDVYWDDLACEALRKMMVAVPAVENVVR